MGLEASADTPLDKAVLHRCMDQLSGRPKTTGRYGTMLAHVEIREGGCLIGGSYLGGSKYQAAALGIGFLAGRSSVTC